MRSVFGSFFLSFLIKVYIYLRETMMMMALLVLLYIDDGSCQRLVESGWIH